MSETTKQQPFRRLLEEAFSDEGLELPTGLTDLPPMSSRLLADVDVAADVDITDPQLPILPSMPSFPPFPPTLHVAAPPLPPVPLRPAPVPEFASLDDDDLEDQPTRPLPILLPQTPAVVRLKKQVPRPVSAPKRASPAPVARAAPPVDARKLTPHPFEAIVDDATRIDRRPRTGVMQHAREPFEGALDATPARPRTLDLVVDVVPPTDFADLRSLSSPALTPTPSPLPAPAPKPYATGEVRARGEAQRKADALYQQALQLMGAGDLTGALKDLKLATVYDPITPIYRDLGKQIEKKLAKSAPTPTESPALLIISRDGTKRGAPAQAYWTRPKR